MWRPRACAAHRLARTDLGVMQLLKNPLGEGRATPPQPFRPRHFLERFLAPPAGCHSNPGSRVFPRGPGLATAQKSVRRGQSYATAAISAKTFFGAIFDSACCVQLWAGARPAKPGCHSNPGIRAFSRDPGLATAQKSVRRGQSYATAAISAKTPRHFLVRFLAPPGVCRGNHVIIS
jgi:hypothetical protein